MPFIQVYRVFFSKLKSVKAKSHSSKCIGFFFFKVIRFTRLIEQKEFWQIWGLSHVYSDYYSTALTALTITPKSQLCLHLLQAPFEFFSGNSGNSAISVKGNSLTNLKMYAERKD